MSTWDRIEKQWMTTVEQRVEERLWMCNFLRRTTERCRVLLFEKALLSAAFWEAWQSSAECCVSRALQAFRCCFSRCTVLSSGSELHWIVHYVAFSGRPTLSLSLALSQDFAQAHAEPAFLDSEWMWVGEIYWYRSRNSIQFQRKARQKNTFESCSGKSENEDTWYLIIICTLQKQELKIEFVENNKLYVFGSAVDFLFK